MPTGSASGHRTTTLPASSDRTAPDGVPAAPVTVPTAAMPWAMRIGRLLAFHDDYDVSKVVVTAVEGHVGERKAVQTACSVRQLPPHVLAAVVVLSAVERDQRTAHVAQRPAYRGHAQSQGALSLSCDRTGSQMCPLA